MNHTELLWQGITALVTILTIVAAYLKTKTANKVNHADTAQKLDAVQTTVNGQADALHSRISQLTNSLVDAGVPIPEPPKQGS